ncbi:MAG: hypothetical protein WD894_20775 [Pirellulales bacterium]
MYRFLPEPTNPYQSPGWAADARGKLGWLVMLAILWPIVMAAVGSIIGYFLGRLAPEDMDQRIWNPGTTALGGAAVFALIGIVIGLRKASMLRRQLEEIHLRREELRQEMERRRADGSGKTGRGRSESNDWAPDGRAP